VQQLADEIISDLRLAGDAAYNNYEFHKAIENLKPVHTRVCKVTCCSFHSFKGVMDNALFFDE
jgi:hypothetical protein